MNLNIKFIISGLLLGPLFLMVGCDTLSNRSEKVRVQCSLNEVNDRLEYVQFTGPGFVPLESSTVTSLEIQFIHSDGHIESLKASRRACVALPQAKGQLSVRSSSNGEWVSFTNIDQPTAQIKFRQMELSERGQLNLSMPCPDQGFLGSQSLTKVLLLQGSQGNLQNLQLQLSIKDSAGKALGTLFSKEFGQKNVELPEQFSLAALDAGNYSIQLSLRDSFFGNNPKSLLVSSQCPLVVKRSCESPNDNFDVDDMSCKPKLCENTYRVGEFWTEDLANKRGSGTFTCQLKEGIATRAASEARCVDGFFNANAQCLGAKNVAAGLNHSCAVLESGEISCWGYNVFDTLGPSDKTGTSGTAVGPQPPIPLAEKAEAVAVSSVASCALLSSGRVQCWGLLPQTLDEQGTMQYAVQGYPQWVKKADGSDLNQVEALIAGGGPDHDTFCVITQDQAALCWGKDLFSKSQTTQFGSWLYPRPVFAEKKIKSLAITDREICAVDTLGKVVCQGSGLADELDRINDAYIAVPVEVALPGKAKAIFSRSIGKCALLEDETLYCWGLRTDRTENLEWNFNHGVPDIPRNFTKVLNREKFNGQVKDIGLNGEISCILTKDFQPVCQPGANDYDSEFIGNRWFNLRPTRLNVQPILDPNGDSLQDIREISVGFWHGCGVHSSGRVYCWGNNQFGRLGNGVIAGSGKGMGVPRTIHATLIKTQ